MTEVEKNLKRLHDELCYATRDLGKRHQGMIYAAAMIARNVQKEIRMEIDDTKAELKHEVAGEDDGTN